MPRKLVPRVITPLWSVLQAHPHERGLLVPDPDTGESHCPPYTPEGLFNSWVSVEPNRTLILG
jgi:hypothetical protein